MKEEIQKDLDDGKFGMICSNEETFMSYVMQKYSKNLEQLRAEVESLGKIVIWQDEKYIKDTGGKEVYKYVPNGITWEYENDEDWLMTIDLSVLITPQQ
jgi:hypothetical protein